MPVFRLSKKIEFPPPWLARFDGLLCMGGDLHPHRIICAYRRGIFPWFSDGEPLLWWSPDPRLVMFPEKIKISRSLKRKIRKNFFKITMDSAFDQVIQSCAQTRTEMGEETWLGDDMIRAYSKLHEMGYCHSVEAWHEGELAGGLYGLFIGRTFFGESMFTKVSDASKVCLAALCAHLQKKGGEVIDCQVTTSHLLSMGALEIPRSRFLEIVHHSLEQDDLTGVWQFEGFL